MLVLLVAVVGGVLPTLFYVLLVWWLDRYEKEPVWLLTLAFLWGAVPAALLSLLLEVMLDVPISAFGGESLAANLISTAIGAPLVEESVKGIALIGLILLFRREFDDVLDGIIYGAMIGCGFAFTETLFAYFVPIASEQGLAAGSVNIFLRSFVFGLNHAFWTAITGAALGYARLSRDPAGRLLAPIGGWTVAVLFHAIHNAGASLAEQTACLSLGISLIVDWGGVLMLLLIAALILRKESGWIERGLVEEVHDGLLSPEEVDLLRSSGQRLRRRWSAWSRGGLAAYRAVGRYYQCATELAFKRQQLRSMGDEGGNLAEVQRLRQDLASLYDQTRQWLV